MNVWLSLLLAATLVVLGVFAYEAGMDAGARHVQEQGCRAALVWTPLV